MDEYSIDGIDWPRAKSQVAQQNTILVRMKLEGRRRDIANSLSTS